MHGRHIRKFTCILDYEMLGYPVRAKILIVAKKDKEELIKYLAKNESLNSVYRVNNGFDYLVEGIFRSMHEVESFLEELSEHGMQKAQVLYVLENLKEEAFLTNSLIMG
jgi:DNA-binding Lrp family transcriptional regulator